MKNKNIKDKRDYLLKIIILLCIIIHSIITFIPLFLLSIIEWIFNNKSFVETYKENWIITTGLYELNEEE